MARTRARIDRFEFLKWHYLIYDSSVCTKAGDGSCLFSDWPVVAISIRNGALFPFGIQDSIHVCGAGFVLKVARTTAHTTIITWTATQYSRCSLLRVCSDWNSMISSRHDRTLTFQAKDSAEPSAPEVHRQGSSFHRVTCAATTRWYSSECACGFNSGTVLEIFARSLCAPQCRARCQRC